MSGVGSTPASFDWSAINQRVSDTIANATRASKSVQDTPQTRKLKSSAQQFEALLIANLWREMQQSSLDPGDSDSVLGAGSETLQGLGMNAMATAIAGGGGLGIARMLFRSLEPSLARDSSGAATGQTPTLSSGSTRTPPSR